jgi:hypothetical protein
MVVFQDGNFKIIKDGTSYYRVLKGRKRVASYLTLSDAKDYIQIAKTWKDDDVEESGKNKRFVVYSSWQLGIESSYENENGKDSPFWYVFDKLNNKIVDCVQPDNKRHILKESKWLNDQHRQGILNERILFDK